MINAYEKGYTVFRRGTMDKKARHKNLVGNPFKSKTSSYREWERGFSAAYFEQLKKVRLNEQGNRRETYEGSRTVLQNEEQSKNYKE